MPKESVDLVTTRREEIINACELLYKTKSFKDITVKDIAQVTSFSRPSIYNYFQTKEEIFLALFEREYRRWNGDLQDILCKYETLTAEKLAKEIASSLANRPQLLKLLAMNNFDMEENSRLERLVSFKAAYGQSIQLIKRILEQFSPHMSESDRQRFIYVFFPFMVGIYPYTYVTDKQKKAMKEANLDYTYESVFDLIYSCLLSLLVSQSGE